MTNAAELNPKGFSALSNADVEVVPVRLTRAELLVFSLLLFLSSFAKLPFNSFFGLAGTFSSNGFILLCVGVLLMFISHRFTGVRSRLTRQFLTLTALLVLINVVMSFYLSLTVGTMFGETPLTTGLATLCWLACHAGAVIYISHCYSDISNSLLDRLFDFMLVFVLAISILQVGIIVGIPGFRAVYDALNFGDWLQLSICRYERLCGVASEPSGMAAVICMLCFPYAASKFLSTHRARYGLSLVLLVFVAYFTYSSTVYVSLLFSLIAFVVVSLSAKGGRIPRGAIVSLMLALVVALLVGVVAVTSDNVKDNEVVSSISTLFEKVTDDNNQSTAYRNSTVTNDLKIFLDYPVLGVGEGNQGYFYADNIDVSVLNSGSLEARNAINGKIGVLNGGSFLPSLISGFGLVGTLAYVAWVIGGVRQASRGRAVMGSYYQMYLIALVGGLPSLWIGTGFSGLPIVFFLVLGMPFLAERARINRGVV